MLMPEGCGEYKKRAHSCSAHAIRSTSPRHRLFLTCLCSTAYALRSTELEIELKIFATTALLYAYTPLRVPSSACAIHLRVPLALRFLCIPTSQCSRLQSRSSSHSSVLPSDFPFRNPFLASAPVSRPLLSLSTFSIRSVRHTRSTMRGNQQAHQPVSHYLYFVDTLLILPLYPQIAVHPLPACCIMWVIRTCSCTSPVLLTVLLTAISSPCIAPKLRHHRLASAPCDHPFCLATSTSLAPRLCISHRLVATCMKYDYF